MSQTAYALEPAVASAGLLSDMGQSQIHSRTNEEVVDIPFGIAMKKGTTFVDDGSLLPTASGDKVEGVTVSTPARDNIGLATAGVNGIRAGARYNLLRKGRVWVNVEQAVVPTDTIFFRYASGGGGTQKGSFRKDADTATAAQWKGARFMNSQATIGGLVIIECDALVYWW